MSSSNSDKSDASDASRKAVYAIVEKQGRKHWIRIGTGVVNRDGSINISLDALPMNGQIHVRDAGDRMAIDVAKADVERE